MPEQTDSTPFITSIGHAVHPYGAAISRDLLESEQVCYGDVVIIGHSEVRIVNDTMHKRHKRHIDLWVATKAQEKSIGHKNLPVMVIVSPERRCGK